MLSKLFSFRFWFAMNPGGWQDLRLVVLAAGLLLVILGAVGVVGGKRLKKQNRYYKFFIRIGRGLLVVGVLDLLLWFWRDQQVPFFAARFWYLLLILGVVAWISWLVVSFVKFKQRLVEEEKRRREFDKYLPRSNK